MIQQEINAHLLEWDRMILQFREYENRAARADNDYRHGRARFIITAKADDPRLSHAAAETLADADDEVMRLRLLSKGAEAEAKSFMEKLKWCRAKADALRSEKVDERESNKLYADHTGGA